jgi:hypothetical protein
MIDYQAFVFTMDYGLITIDCLIKPYLFILPKLICYGKRT